ncbi:AMP-binding protein [Streptomyces sp. NBC_00057]|uniref:AMP-binding protein n=1 Tax=Streptomyces sp. NBC_00057 TaxID=2975634 RepID=UPI003254102F
MCKAGATFVPLDPASPPERIAYILGDAGAAVLLTTGVLMPRTGHAETEEPGACRVIRTDAWASELACLPTTRPPADTSAAGRYEFADFLETHRVTVLYCVPTLPATIPRELPRVRSVVVGPLARPFRVDNGALGPLHLRPPLRWTRF